MSKKDKLLKIQNTYKHCKKKKLSCVTRKKFPFFILFALTILNYITSDSVF